MEKSWEPVKIKVLLGYLFLISIASFTVWVIYSEILRFSGNKTDENLLNNRIRYVNNILTNLYQAEVLEGNYSQTGNPLHYRDYEHLMDVIYLQVDTLSHLSDNTLQHIHSDSIHGLLDKKRKNLQELVSIKRMGSSDDLYKRAMNKVTYNTDSIYYFLNIYKTVTDNRDSTYIQQKKKKFFERLIDAFASQEKQDSTLQVKTRQSVQVDSLINHFNPADSVARFLSAIMRDIRAESVKIERQLAEKEGEVLKNDHTITLQLRRMLSIFENDAFVHSFHELHTAQARVRQTTWSIVTLGIFALLIIIIFLVLILKDISRSQHYRRELEQAKAYSDSLLKSKEQFMLSITHDIKSPLASVMGYSRLMSEAVIKEQKDYYLNNINNSIEHILKLINDLVDLIRLETGKLKIQHSRFNLKTLVNEIFAGFDPIASSKNIRLRLEYNLSPQFEYNSDSLRLKQILVNLISNAIKFTDHGEVVLRVSFVEASNNIDRIEFDVKDTGIGISEQDSKLIFDEFAQVASNSHKRYEGVGLGLTISQRLVSLLNGTISLTSRLGKGSQFTVFLPMERCSTPAPDPANIAGPELSLEAIKVLLIDDDETFLNLVAEILQKAQMEVIKCNLPSMALQALEQNMVDVVITDIQMPTMTGVELLAHIQEKTGKDIPAIAITGQRLSDPEEHLKFGFAACLHKPFLPEQLFESISKVLIHKPINGIKINNICNVDPESFPTKSYTLNQIRKFAANDPQSVHRILTSFVETSSENMALFRKYIDEKNHQSLSELAHKMLSMFRQLEAVQVIDPLTEIERIGNNQLTDEQWNELGIETLGKVEQFIDTICEEQDIDAKI